MQKMIYAILSEKNNPEKLNTILLGMKGLAGTVLYTVYFDEITAVVSDINRANLITDQSNAIAYASVIEKLVEQFSLLPMRYGSLMESRDSINKMLERNYPEFQQNLQKVENKYEFGLKIFCDSGKLKAELRAKSETDTKTPTKSVPGIKNSVYRNYVNKKLKEHRIEELVLIYVDSVIAEITGYLARLNAVNKFKKIVSETNIISAIFLLGKDKKDKLIQAVENLQNQYPGLTFVLTGPWPPYNFVEITIK